MCFRSLLGRIKTAGFVIFTSGTMYNLPIFSLARRHLLSLSVRDCVGSLRRRPRPALRISRGKAIPTEFDHSAVARPRSVHASYVPSIDAYLPRAEERFSSQ